jgi:hypothetical protein
MITSEGSGMQALSIAMQSRMPPYPRFEIVERMNAETGARIDSRMCIEGAVVPQAPPIPQPQRLPP